MRDTLTTELAELRAEWALVPVADRHGKVGRTHAVFLCAACGLPPVQVTREYRTTYLGEITGWSVRPVWQVRDGEGGWLGVPDAEVAFLAITDGD